MFVTHVVLLLAVWHRQRRKDYKLLHAKTRRLGEWESEESQVKVASPDKAAGSPKALSPFAHMIEVASPAAALASRVCTSPIEVIGPNVPENVLLAQDMDFEPGDGPELSEESEAGEEAPDVLRDVLAEASNRQEFLWSPEHLEHCMHQAAKEAALLKAQEAERSGDHEVAIAAQEEARAASDAAASLVLGPLVPIPVKPLADAVVPPCPSSPPPLQGEPPSPPRSVSVDVRFDEASDFEHGGERLAILRQADRAECEDDGHDDAKPEGDSKARPKAKAKAKAKAKGKAAAKAGAKAKAKAKAKGRPKAKATPKAKAKAEPKAAAGKSKAKPSTAPQENDVEEPADDGGRLKRKKVGKALCTDEEKKNLKTYFSLHVKSNVQVLSCASNQARLCDVCCCVCLSMFDLHRHTFLASSRLWTNDLSLKPQTLEPEP